MVRERLTGAGRLPPPQSSSNSGGEFIEDRAGDDLDALLKNIENQRDFARGIRELLSSLDMADDTSLDSEERRERGRRQRQRQGASSRARANPSRNRRASVPKIEMSAKTRRDDMEEGASEADGPSGEMPDEADESNSEDAAESMRPPLALQRAAGPDYRAFSTKFDEVIHAEDLCDADELTRLRAYLDKQLAHLQGVVGASRQPAAASAAGTAEPGLGVRPRRGHARSRPPAARRHGSVPAALVQARAGHEFPRHRRDAAARQFRLDARTARSPWRPPAPTFWRARSSAAASRSRSSASRPRHGRAGRRGSRGCRAASLPIPAASTTCATSSTNPPMHLGGGRARISALMMREGLLKENIDGEALDWAHKRLLARPEQRRIMMVISDGAPVDDSTLSVNPGNYLERHLRYVIDEIETRSPVELIAIGIGHDVTRYYRRAVTIVDAEELGGVMTEKLAELFDEKGACVATRADSVARSSLEADPPLLAARRRSARGGDCRGPGRREAPAGFHEADRRSSSRPNLSSRFSVSDPDRSRFGELAFRSGLDLRSLPREFGGFSALWRSAMAARSSPSPTMRNGCRATVETARRTAVGSVRRRPDAPDARPAASVCAGRDFTTRRASQSPGRPLCRASNATMRSCASPGTARTFSRRRADRVAGRSGGSRPATAGWKRSAVAPAAIAARRRAAGRRRTDAGSRDADPRLHPDRARARSSSRWRARTISTSPTWRFCRMANCSLLERRFSYLGGLWRPPAARRCRRDQAGPSGRRAGDFQSDASQQIDNMEGLAIHREGGDTVLTMMSDDNFNGIQRTLLLEFALVEMTELSGPLGGRAPHDHQRSPRRARWRGLRAAA